MSKKEIGFMLTYQILHVYIGYLSETLGVVCTFADSE